MDLSSIFFYVEFYDFWHPVAFIDETLDSRFLLYKNNPSALIAYLLNEVLTKATQDVYAQYGKQLYALWSIQDIGGDCIYPAKAGGPCGANYEFGSWSPAAMNEFLRQVSGVYPFNTFEGHALFQFSFMPNSWM